MSTSKKKTSKSPPPAPSRASGSRDPETFKIVRDSREKSGQGWRFKCFGSCSGTVIGPLKTGDYTIAGLEAVLCIERKGSCSEFVTNLYDKRFHRELERMQDIPNSYVICEFDFQDIMDWPAAAGGAAKCLPKHLLIPKGPLAKFRQISEKYPHVNFIFAGDKARTEAKNIIKRIASENGYVTG